VPVATVEATFMVIVELPEPGAGIGLGLKDTVTPLGWPEADKVIAALNPPERVLVMVDAPLEPSATETEAGEGVSVKLGPVVTVRVTVVVCVKLPLVPVTVMG